MCFGRNFNGRFDKFGCDSSVTKVGFEKREKRRSCGVILGEFGASPPAEAISGRRRTAEGGGDSALQERYEEGGFGRRFKGCLRTFLLIGQDRIWTVGSEKMKGSDRIDPKRHRLGFQGGQAGLCGVWAWQMWGFKELGQGNSIKIGPNWSFKRPPLLNSYFLFLFYFF